MVGRGKWCAGSGSAFTRTFSHTTLLSHSSIHYALAAALYFQVHFPTVTTSEGKCIAIFPKKEKFIMLIAPLFITCNG